MVRASAKGLFVGSLLVALASACSGGSGDPAGGGGSGGAGGTGGRDSIETCADLCSVLEGDCRLGSRDDPDAPFDCARWCEEDLSAAKIACLAPIAGACDWGAYEPCLEESTEFWCPKFCSRLAGCGGDRSTGEETCVLECTREEVLIGTAGPACMDAAVDACDMEELAACFVGDEACAAMCNHAYLECGLPLVAPSGLPVGWRDCMYLCGADLWTEDQRHCLATASCDAAALGACQPETCEGLCSDLAACGSGNSSEAKRLCLDSCDYRWTWGIGGSFSCLAEAASTCDANAIASCFPSEPPACTAACNHVYFDCGVELRDPSTGRILDREACVAFCGQASQEQVECLTTAQCRGVGACLAEG